MTHLDAPPSYLGGYRQDTGSFLVILFQVSLRELISVPLMPAEDSPAILVARFLRAGHYTEVPGDQPKTWIYSPTDQRQWITDISCFFE